MDSFERRNKLQLEILESTEERAHFHQDIELLYVLQGSMDVTVEQDTSHMEREDVLIVNANRRHQLTNGTNVMYCRLSIQYELVSDVEGDYGVFFLCDSTRNTQSAYDGLRALLQKLLSRYIFVQGNTADFYYISLCYQILGFLTENFLIRNKTASRQGETDRFADRISQIDNYILANFRQPIGLKDLSAKLYLSEGYLARFFKKTYGMSFADYITDIRLHYAVEELLYTDMPVIRVMYDSGFTSENLFYKAFREAYGVTPTEMRKRAAGGPDRETKKLPEDVEKRLSGLLAREEKKENAVVSGTVEETLDVNKKTPCNPYWSDAINVGAASDLLRSEVQEHVKILKNELNFRYVRFWSPFSKELLIDVNAKGGRYKFSRLDEVLDFLTEQGIIPFIELATKPDRIQASSTDYLLYERYDEAESVENWSSVLTAFLQHVVTRYGEEAVSRWRFELWFDMECLGNKEYTLRYMNLLKITISKVHTIAGAKIGGPGLHAISRESEEKTSMILSFFDTMLEKKAVPDFLTWYAYAYNTEFHNRGMVSIRSSDFDFFPHVVELWRKLLKPEYQSVPVYITEWNMTISDRNMINDSCFEAAYIVKNYIDLYGEVMGFAYFDGTDRISEYYDNNDFLFGGKGLITIDGIMKPSAYAFDFLKRLYPNLIGKGSSFIATANDSDHYGIVCHNCKPLSAHYYCIREDKLDLGHLNQYFENMDPLTLRLTLKNVANGIYHVKIYRINMHHGSVQTLWMETGCEEELSRSDIEYFSKGSIPNLTMKNIEVTNGQLHLTIRLEANEIAFIRARRRVSG